MSRSPAPLHRAGYRLFPLHKQEKVPLLRGWRHAEHSVDELREYKRRGHNLGVALDEGQVVLDFDPRRGDDREFVETFYGIDLSGAPCVRSGGGGWHYYFRTQPEVRLIARDSAVPGLDIKQVGGLVVAPGSIHPSGGYYEIEGKWKVPPLLVPPEEWLRTTRTPERESAEWTPGQLHGLLEQFDPRDFREYDRWVKLLTACHHATGGDPEAEKVFEEWSTSDPEYVGAGPGIEYRWDLARINRKGAATVATLIYWAEEYEATIPSPEPEEVFSDLIENPEGEEPGDWESVWDYACSKLARKKTGEPKDTLANVRRVVRVWQKHAQWAHDVFYGHIVTRGESTFCTPGQQWDDQTLLVFRGQLNDYTPSWSPSTTRFHEAVDEIAERNRFHPVIEWLDTLEWDGENRIDDWLFRYMGCGNPKPGPAVDPLYVREVGRLLLNAMVARVERPGCKFDHMVVFEGEQGVGKSTACEILGGRWYSDNAPIGIPTKDAISTMTGVWVFEVGELDALRRSDIRQLKSFLSATGDRARLAYARKAVTVPRQCVFLGTTNDRTYLSDETGNRRFLPLPVGDVDLDGLRRDRDQLLAEAWEKRTRAPLTLSKQANLIAIELQEDRRVVSGTEHILDQVLNTLENDFVTALDLLTMVGAKPSDTFIARQIATLMSSRGWEKTRKNGQRGFHRVH